MLFCYHVLWLNKVTLMYKVQSSDPVSIVYDVQSVVPKALRFSGPGRGIK